MPTPMRPVDFRLDPFDLRLFVAVIDTGTITAAAQTLGLSLAAASTRLKGLEARVGTPLLVRTKSGAALTDAGLALTEHAHRILSGMAALHADMSRFADGLRGTLKLYGNTSAVTQVLPPLLGDFLTRHRAIDLDLQDMPSEAVLEALRRGACDVGIVASHVDTQGLPSHRWVDDDLVALLPGRQRSAKALSLHQLLERPWVGLPEDSGLSRFLAQQARRGGRLPHYRVRVGSLEAVVELVAAGAGVAILPQRAVLRSPHTATHLRVQPLQDAWARRHLCVCTTPASAERPAVSALVNALRQAR
ncbi:LysR family transcriptional regulator [Hydrogenophaga sp. NFH-34]|uniref:LysR family transcriptional regulator n=1 Tax=Hydrogenophaga sp. NFH-34 TaxID=2744446 RepID=UPI001F176E56|nr:LysR family transcriptional regulator [Hydrogenophaga sp. NFH-34]